MCLERLIFYLGGMILHYWPLKSKDVEAAAPCGVTKKRREIQFTIFLDQFYVLSLKKGKKRKPLEVFCQEWLKSINHNKLK